MDLSDWRSTATKPFRAASEPQSPSGGNRRRRQRAKTAGSAYRAWQPQALLAVAGDVKPRRILHGSVLVMVLWILVLVSFLAGQYLAHNREKADIAQNAWTAFRQRQAVSSVVQLFSTDAWPIPDGTGADGRWFRLFPDDIALWVRVDKESLRTNLNTASDGEIKQKLALMMGDEFSA